VGQVTVRVYNGGYTTGQAQRVQTRLEDFGYQGIRIANTEEQIKVLTIRANKAQVGQIRLVASQFVDPKIEYDDRVDGTVDILLPTEKPVYGETPLFQVAAPGGTVCVVPAKEPTPTPTPTPTREP